eukprot:2716235-Karenia_brevis.AAC.1
MEFFVDKYQGVVSHNWEDLAKLEVVNAEDLPLIYWDNEFVTKYGIDKERVAQEFSASLSRSSARDARWSL